MRQYSTIFFTNCNLFTVSRVRIV